MIEHFRRATRIGATEPQPTKRSKLLRDAGVGGKTLGDIFGPLDFQELDSEARKTAINLANSTSSEELVERLRSVNVRWLQAELSATPLDFAPADTGHAPMQEVDVEAENHASMKLQEWSATYGAALMLRNYNQERPSRL